MASFIEKMKLNLTNHKKNKKYQISLCQSPRNKLPMKHLNIKINLLKMMKQNKANKLKYQFYRQEIILFNNPKENSSMDLEWMKLQ